MESPASIAYWVLPVPGLKTSFPLLSIAPVPQQQPVLQGSYIKQQLATNPPVAAIPIGDTEHFILI